MKKKKWKSERNKGSRGMVAVMLDNDLDSLVKVVDSSMVSHMSIHIVVLEILSVKFEPGSDLLENGLHAVGLLPQNHCFQI